MKEYVYSKSAKTAIDKIDKSEKGEAILFIHAGIADKRMWKNEVNLLENQYFVINIDLPGFGESEILGSEIEYTDVLKTVLDYYGLQKVTVIAASFGAKLAIDFCLIHPQFISKMIVISPAVSGWEDSAEIIEYERAEEELISLPELVELNYHFWIKRDRDADSIDSEVKDLMYEMLSDNLSLPDQEVKEIELISDSLKCIENIKQPVLIINGEKDVSDFIKIGKLMSNKIQCAELKMIPNAGHLPNLENPNLFNQYLLEFIK